ncbi:MAG: hypothetical protein AN484_26535 [Aphanizomenon flos-aquae WA102]|uniref:Uncharacterized protein n=1 Tax=Aphanizomenon flos-aquae WA102 TaxID=1710896 RepID=A0A1B7WCA6_APHFL|nr:MAG: hypothetical protein AN484_26535 [Aphanizomenon flos-aquae WA102]
MNNGPDVCRRGVHHDAQGGAGGGVGQGGRLGEGVLGRLKGRLLIWRPGHGGVPLGAPFQGIGEGLQHSGDVGKEPAVEVDHAQKGLQLLHGVRLWKLLDRGDVVLERADAGGGDPVSQEVDRRLSKTALVDVEDQAVVLKTLKNLAEMSVVTLHVRGANDDVVQVGRGVLQVAEHAVHKPLERLPAVPQAEGHPRVLEQAEGDRKSGV